jgi:hypothetical protein
MNYVIEGLTKEQVDMLNIMWSLNNLEDFQDWYDSLKFQDKVMANDLALLLMENTSEKKEESYEQAREVLKQFML